METRRITYTPQGGVCSKLMVIDAKEDVIENVQIVGGCLLYTSDAADD